MGPLHGFRVVEFAGIGPGPFAAMMLADMGADVVTIDRVTPAAPRPPEFEVLRRGRTSIRVDLASPAGADIALDLIAEADAVIEGFRPGVAERLGVGPETAMELNPRLVYGRMTGWGQSGPLALKAGHDINYISMVGALHAVGEPDGPPVPPVNLLGDYGGGGMLLALGVVSALLAARSSGRGQVVDAAIVDGAALLMASHWGLYAEGTWRDERGANTFDGGAPHYGVYKCSDGHYVAVGPLEEKFLSSFVQRLSELTGVQVKTDIAERHGWTQARHVLTEIFRTRTRQEWLAGFSELDACITPVLSMAEATRDEHLVARGTFVDVEGVYHPAPAPRFSRTPSLRPARPPARGAHTVEVLRRLGRSEAEITHLLDTGIAAINES